VALDREQLIALARAHVRAEADRDVEATLATLEDHPVFELHPLGVRFAGRDLVRRYYEWLLHTFVHAQRGTELRGEYVGETTVANEYTIRVEMPDGQIAAFGVVAVLQAGEHALSGERVYLDPVLARMMVGPVLDEAEAISF
jgi:hypothetical protein